MPRAFFTDAVILHFAACVGSDVMFFFFLHCDHELFFLCVHRGQVHVPFMWLD